MTTTLMRLIVAACVVTGLVMTAALPAMAQSRAIRIVQTNAAGDNVHLIAPVTNKIVDEITGVEVIHGVVAAPDGERLGGLAPRVLYRFHVTGVSDTHVEIGDVEEDVLLFLT